MTAPTLSVNYNAFQLALRADCSSPDSTESAGARFLLSVQDAVNEQWDNNHADWREDQPSDSTWWNDLVHEIADAAPDVYTYKKWCEFVDLGAWQEDLSDYGPMEDDVDRIGSIALYVIAERLAYALFEELCELDDDSDGEEDGDNAI